MTNTRYVLVLLLCIFVVHTVLADDPIPDDISATISDPYLLADGIDSTPIVVVVYNQSSPVPGLKVDFLIDEENLGTLNPDTTITSQSGAAETEFSANTELGSLLLSAKVFYTLGDTEYSKEFAIGTIQVQSPSPDSIVMNTSKEWVIANGNDQSIISLIATFENRPVPGLSVDFSLMEPDMGAIDQAQDVTDENGIATVRFTTSTKSGNATLSAYTLYQHEELEIVNETPYIQKVDHDLPYRLESYNVPSQISVGASAPVIVRYVDRWDNPIDNRNIAEEVYFEISSTEEDATFLDASPPYTSIQEPVDVTGSATVWFKASESPGLNVILADPVMNDVEEKYFFIQGVANRSPTLLEQEFDPDGYLDNPPKQYSDGVSLYAITYTLRDEFGNGVMNSAIQINTTIPGEERTIYTNALGQALLTYGPKTSIGQITITATSLDNTSVSCTKEVWFISQEAADMQFTVVPESMPSRDVEGWAPALLMAKVIDENGNPVEGEEVTFSLGTPVYEETYNVTMDPELVSETVISNSDGYAISYFNPGAFSVDWQDPLIYDDTATGTIPITAVWENVTRGKYSSQTLAVSWKNYPYLSLETFVSPQTVNVTGIIDVLIRLKGDGWALHPKPIDVVLCTDRSGSMLRDETDRMVSVMAASKTFVGAMHVSPTRDHIGLVSFGTDGWAKLSPEYRYLDNWYYCYRSYHGW
ncbi:MAG TPA: Ig-like domain-containing protein, partial [Methanoregulaceae archaeon]|nr:Ig-like domain-containing protein [Methanoregulaceae archaeon]